MNLNTSGNEEILTGTTGFARSGIDRGWTTAEVGLPIDASAVWSGKFGADGVPGGTGDDRPVGWEERFWRNAELSFDGIDNDGDGVVDEWRRDGIDNDGDGVVDEADEGIEGINEPSEFVFIRGGRVTLESHYVKDDRPFITVGETRVEGIEPSLYTTLYSRDRHTDQDRWFSAPGVEEDKININTTPLTHLTDPNLYDTLLNIPSATPPTPLFTPAEAAQIAVNIVNFRDADDNPTEWGGKRGIERTLFINEIRMDRYGFWLWHWFEVDRFELHNPWDTTVSGWYKVEWTDASGDVRPIFNQYIEILPERCQAFSYNLPSDTNPGGSIRLRRCAVGDGTDFKTIETLDITPINARVFHAKNDPRVPAFNYTGPVSSLGVINTGQNFTPGVGGEVTIAHWAGHFNHFNRDFHNIGELGHIHTGGQWETLAMRDIDTDGDGTIDRPHQGAILNRVTIGHPYNRMGRININTASRGVLDSLPQMFQGT